MTLSLRKLSLVPLYQKSTKKVSLGLEKRFFLVPQNPTNEIDWRFFKTLVSIQVLSYDPVIANG